MRNYQPTKKSLSTLILASFTFTLIVVTFATITGDLGSILKVYKTESPDLWALPHGQKVDIGGEMVEVIGDDDCENGTGKTYSCWMFSLTPGDGKHVLLSNGTSEVWTTAAAGSGRIHLLRPNGYKVHAM